MFRLLSLVALIVVVTMAADSPTVSPIARPANQGFEPCHICGEGKTVSFLRRALQLPGQPEVSCEALQEAGLEGYIDPAFCPIFPSMIEAECKCVVGSPPTSAPTSSAPTVPSPDSSSSAGGLRALVSLVLPAMVFVVSMTE